MGNGQYLQLMFRYGAYYATMIVLLVLGIPRLDDLAPDVMANGHLSITLTIIGISLTPPCL